MGPRIVADERKSCQGDGQRGLLGIVPTAIIPPLWRSLCMGNG